MVLITGWVLPLDVFRVVVLATRKKYKCKNLSNI